MAIIKKRDFVEIEYTGKFKDDGVIFDTTKGSPLVICVGENSFLKGLEDHLVGKETGQEYTFELSYDNAFGKKDAKLIQLIPTNKFRQQNIQPIPGLKLNIDGVFGVIKTVSGGRCLVDFNHPLAGKDLFYNVKINKVIEDTTGKLKSILKLHLNTADAEIEIKEESAEIKSKHSIPNQLQEEFIKIVKKTLPPIKNVSFTINEEKK